MKLNVGNLKYLVKVLNNQLVGSYIHRFVEYSKTDYVFGLSKNKDQQVIISLQSSHPFILLGQVDELKSTLSSSFFLQLRKELEHALIRNVELWNNDRIIAIEIESQNEIYEINKRYLVIELITGTANLLLLDEDKKILLAYKTASLEQVRPIFKGLPYILPSKNEAFQVDIEEIPFSLEQQFNDYALSLKNKRRKDKFERVIKCIRSNKKSLLKKIKKQEQELLAAENKETYKLYGDLLFTYMWEIKSYGDEITLDEITIPLDKDKSLKDNALSYYKKYQKSKSALEHLETQLKINNEELAYFDTLEQQYEFADERDLLEIEEELVINGYLKDNSPRKKKSKKTYEPYFIYYNGVKIGYGKNNLQNDYLTFTLASKNDKFIHILNCPGSHIVIFDSNPSNEVIAYASELVLFLSHKNDGDVVYTSVSELSKTNKKGLVSFKKYQTFHLPSYNKEKFTSLH